MAMAAAKRHRAQDDAMAMAAAKRHRAQDDALNGVSIPIELFIRILSFCQIPDLLRYCLVCKDWKNIILFSDSFRKLHSESCRPEKGILIHEAKLFRHVRFAKTGASSRNLGPIPYEDKALSRVIVCQDKGLVCIGESILSDEELYWTWKVVNPFFKSWKTIASNSSYYPLGMSVKESGAYLILAANSREFMLGVVHTTYVFDSRKNTWSKAAPLNWKSAAQFIQNSSPMVISHTLDKAALYSFEQDSWSLISIRAFDDILVNVQKLTYRSLLFQCNTFQACIRLGGCKLKAALESPHTGKLLGGDEMAAVKNWEPSAIVCDQDAVAFIFENCSCSWVLRIDLVKGSSHLSEILPAPRGGLGDRSAVCFVPSFFQP